MKKNKKLEPENGVLTSSMNVNNKEFKEFQLLLSMKSKSLSEREKLQIDFFAEQLMVGKPVKTENKKQ